MQKLSDKITLALKLSLVTVAVALVTGCMSAKSAPTQPAQKATAPAAAPVVSSELTSWTVEKGDNLWTIAGKEEIYNVPEKWPLIYKANLDQIEDADLIYPNQVLDIPRTSSQREIDSAITHAKTRGAWAIGPLEISDKTYLKTAG